MARIPEQVVAHAWEFCGTLSACLLECYLRYEVVGAEDFIEESADQMYIPVADLDEYRPRVREEVVSDDKPIPQVGQVGMNSQLPCIPKGSDLLGLPSSILRPPILYVQVLGRNLPVGRELDAVWRVYIYALNLALEAFPLGK